MGATNLPIQLVPSLLLCSISLFLFSGNDLLGQEGNEERFQGKIGHRLNIYLEEEFEEENDHEAYGQLYPVTVPFGVRSAAGQVNGALTFTSRCEWKAKAPSPKGTAAFPFLPQEGEGPPLLPPRERPPGTPVLPSLVDDPWEFPHRPDLTTVPWNVPLRPVLPLNLTVRVSNLNTTLEIGGGSIFQAEGLSLGGSQVPVTPPSAAPPSPPAGGVPPLPAPPNPTKAIDSRTKSSLLGAEGDDDPLDASDSPVLVGPAISMPLFEDTSRWVGLAWLPSGSRLDLYGHVLAGDMRILDQSVDVRLFSGGPRLGLPLVRGAEIPWEIDGTLALGPAFLQTDLGEAIGLSVTAGVSSRIHLAAGLALVASLDYEGFLASDVRAHGPSANLGVVLAW